MTKPEGMTKPEDPNDARRLGFIRASSFGFHSGFVIRHSDFFRISAFPPSRRGGGGLSP
jgi:hypothetical protein